MIDEILFRVSDIKQYFYCPRIIFFTYVCPVPRKSTFKMDMGKEEHEAIQELEKRRLLKHYGLEEGSREFHLKLSSARLHLNGTLDLLIRSPQGFFPVEFKFSSRKPSLNHKYQLAAYALLVEDYYGVAIRQGFLYFHPVKKIYPLLFTQGVKDFTKRTVNRLLEIINSESIPPPARYKSRCTDCEYKNYCGGA